MKLNKLFFGTVVLPTLLASIYYGWIASDIYISESRFIVRSPQQQTSVLGEMLKGSGFSRAQDDSYTVQDFILSRDALKGLDEEFHIKKIYSSASIDALSRFAGFSPDDSMEEFYRYYGKRIVDLQLDSGSSIATLVTRAFSAEDAYRINQRLLEMSEKLINQLNERAQQDMIRFSLREVEEAEAKAKEAALNLAEYRNQKGVLDPEKESVIPQQEIAKLEDELIATKTEISQLETLAVHTPQLPTLRQRVKLLEREIRKVTTSIAGGTGEHSLASKASEYKRLALEKEFTDKMLASALSGLEQTRNEAQRKQLYLERIVQPSKPDMAMEPRRLRTILAVFVLGLMAWGILTMLVAGIKEHQA